jgi:hypothetical protein
MFQLKWKKAAIPSKALKRKCEVAYRNKEKHKRYEEHRPDRKLNRKWQQGRL